MIRAAYANLGIVLDNGNSYIPEKILLRIKSALLSLSEDTEIPLHSLQAIIWYVVRRLRLSDNQLKAYGMTE